jgi:RNase H-fold protein (predicted Holliday junction resolvase)
MKISIGIDFGEKFCGFALLEKGMIKPLKVVKTEEAMDFLLKVMSPYDKQDLALVFGFPVSDDGQESPLCAQIKDFAARFSLFVADIVFINERRTSKEVKAFAGQVNQRIDDLSAVRILQYYTSQSKNDIIKP